MVRDLANLDAVRSATEIEDHRDTYAGRNPGETPNDRNDRGGSNRALAFLLKCPDFKPMKLFEKRHYGISII